MLVTCAAMSEAERRFFTDRSPEPWMDEAGRLCAAAILDFYPDPARAEVFCGGGNNGGDALVVARWLRRSAWEVKLHFSGTLSALARKKLAEYEAEDGFGATGPIRPEARPRALVFVDGLVGIGAKGPLRGPVRDLAEVMNERRSREGAEVFAIDLPSGFDADTGAPHPGAVVADFTLSITAAKVGFAADGAERHLGRLVEIPLDIPLDEGDTERGFLFPSNLRPRLPRRVFDTHKGAAGRVVIAAGSPGMAGAAVLAALGASRGGAGLVTVLVPETIHATVAGASPSEVMVASYRDFGELGDRRADVWAVGPGLGDDPAPGLAKFLTLHPGLLVIDADALNFLSRRPSLLRSLPEGRLLTPHPGEMAGLVSALGLDGGADRAAMARAFTARCGASLLLKGARSLIATPGRALEFNSTGHPGMASGGMGDVLTGLCAALVGQGLSLHDAACLGSWLLGRAAELARRDFGIAAESVSAPQVAERIGAARRALWIPESP